MNWDKTMRRYRAAFPVKRSHASREDSYMSDSRCPASWELHSLSLIPVDNFHSASSSSSVEILLNFPPLPWVAHRFFDGCATCYSRISPSVILLFPFLWLGKCGVPLWLSLFEFHSTLLLGSTLPCSASHLVPCHRVRLSSLTVYWTRVWDISCSVSRSFLRGFLVAVRVRWQSLLPNFHERAAFQEAFTTLEWSVYILRWAVISPKRVSSDWCIWTSRQLIMSSCLCCQYKESSRLFPSHSTILSESRGLDTSISAASWFLRRFSGATFACGFHLLTLKMTFTVMHKTEAVRSWLRHTQLDWVWTRRYHLRLLHLYGTTFSHKLVSKIFNTFVPFSCWSAAFPSAPIFLLEITWRGRDDHLLLSFHFSPLPVILRARTATSPETLVRWSTAGGPAAHLPPQLKSKCRIPTSHDKKPKYTCPPGNS